MRGLRTTSLGFDHYRTWIPPHVLTIGQVENLANIHLGVILTPDLIRPANRLPIFNFHRD
jgi:hypothetical protein